MELIFNKTESNFSTELKNVLGFIDSDIVFRKIKPDLLSATKDVVKVIGKPTYEEIVTAYKKENPTDKEQEMVLYSQIAVATQAYRYFAPSNDLAHTANGRKMRNSENEANPFSWMVVQNNDEIQRKAYRAMDDLIEWLDDNHAAWKSTDAFKNTNKLFIRLVDEFDQFYTIGSRLLLIKLCPGIAICERDEILPRIGQELFDSLKTKRQGATSLTAPEARLLSAIQEVCAYRSLSWGLPRLQMQLFPEGIFHSGRSNTQTIESREAALAMEVDSMAQNFGQDAAIALIKLESLIKEAFTDPEDTTVTSIKEIMPIKAKTKDKFFDC